MRILPIVVLFVTFQFALLGQNASSLDTLVILHWNDFHSQNIPFSVSSREDRNVKINVGGAAVFAGYLDSLRSVNKNHLVLSGGDEFQGTPISNFTCGRSQIDLLNVLKPDAMVVGNHEFDYGADSLRENLKRAQFSILCSNVINTADNTTFGLPFVIKKVGNVTVGILGITSPGLYGLTLAKNLNGVRLRSVDSSLALSLAQLREKEHPNLLVLVSHEGLDDDSLLAVQHPELNVIIAAHDHRALHMAKKVNKTIIVEAGSKGQFIGDLSLTIDLKGDSVLGFTDKLIETKGDGVQPDPVIAKMVDGYELIVNKGLSEVIGELKTNWTKSNDDAPESNLGDYEGDAFRTSSGIDADIAFVNSAGIRKTLDAGPIRIRDIWEINPFGNTLVTFTVRGDTLRTMMEWQAGRPSLQVSGIKYSYKPKGDKQADLVSLEVNGKAVEEKKHYTIITNNYVGEHFRSYFGMNPTGITITDTGVIDRDVVVEAVKRDKVITSTVEGRIHPLNQ